MTETPWKKSSYSGGNGGACVEVRRSGGFIEVRDTKAEGSGPVLQFTSAEWSAFLAGATGGEFHDLLD